MVSRAFSSGGTWAFSRPSSPPTSFSALFLHLPSPSPLGLLLFLPFYNLYMLQSTYWLKIHSRTRATLFIDNLNKRHLCLLTSQLHIVTTIFLLNFLIKTAWTRWNENKMFLAFFFHCMFKSIRSDLTFIVFDALHSGRSHENLPKMGTALFSMPLLKPDLESIAIRGFRVFLGRIIFISSCCRL